MKKTDITAYLDSQLILEFQDDKFFSNFYQKAIRRGNFKRVRDFADQFFIYDQNQIDQLEEDFKREVEDLQIAA
jgi:hypothetical protein